MRVVELGSDELQRSRRLRFEPIRAFHFCLCSKSNHFEKTLSEWNNEASAFVVLIIQWRPVLFNSFININSWPETIAHESTARKLFATSPWMTIMLCRCCSGYELLCCASNGTIYEYVIASRLESSKHILKTFSFRNTKILLFMEIFNNFSFCLPFIRIIKNILPNHRNLCGRGFDCSNVCFMICLIS